MLGLPYTLSDIAEIGTAKNLFQGYPSDRILRTLFFDTRIIGSERGACFVALNRGKRDGHDFISQAIQKGVRNFIVDRALPYKEINYLVVEDTLAVIQSWAAAHRQKFHYPILGITGSNGKTTVKEWLATLLAWDFELVKSPMSYNSQLGVALSLLQLRPGAQLALIEAGISQTNEMHLLADMIQPDLGILTHMGEAHAEGFDSFEQKLGEKCLLFEKSKQVLWCDFQPEVSAYLLNHLGGRSLCVGRSAYCALTLLEARENERGWECTLNWKNQPFTVQIPIKGDAALENALLSVLAALHLGMSTEQVANRVQHLHALEMRTEIITDNPEITLINDTYNSDPDSVRNAFSLLQNIGAQRHKKLILSDIAFQSKEIHQSILDDAVKRFGDTNIYTVGKQFAALRSNQAYLRTEELTRSISYNSFIDSVVLLKGSRVFELEKIIPYLNPKLNETYLKIDLGALVENYRALRAQVPANTRTMCMLKAAAYGSGTWEIARVLENEGADYLAVAYISEGIDLRKSGIGLPIMVMNPSPDNLAALFQYKLEPEISNNLLLRKYLAQLHLHSINKGRIHIKLETGMGRLGYTSTELPELISLIHNFPGIEVVSVISHLAAADDPLHDAFTGEQVSRFLEMYGILHEKTGIEPQRQILNSAGILRFPQYAWEMIRLGIAMYGIKTSESPVELREIGSLHTSITQIRSYPAGQSIGYGRSQFTLRPSRIATIPIGYADGIPRSLSNGKAEFLVKGKRAPIFGRVCMDMLMLDVTDITEAVQGDEVVIYGRQGADYISISELAERAGTIPYELLVRVSPRVRRVYELP